MDYDDESFDTPDTMGLKSFKVPKRSLSSTCSIEKISLESSEYRDNILAKIKSNFKSPSSINNFKISKAFTIIAAENEKNFNKRKQMFRKEYSPHAATELYGFLYYPNIKALEKTVKSGKLKIGNLKESYIGKAEMGLSLSQCADIYQCNEGKLSSKNGVLLIVKYMRGRVCYVLEDLNPLDAQPNFDCHISRSFNQDSYPSLNRAFQSTQIYLYEYSEDFDILESPSHVLMWGAVEFQWAGAPIYKLANVPLTVQRLNKDSNQKSVEKRNKLSNRITGSVGVRIKQTFTDCIPVFCTNLQLSSNGDSNSHELSLDVPVTLVSYNPSWNLYGALITPAWRITDLIEWSSFEQFLLNYHWKISNSKSSSNPTTLEESSSFLSDVLTKRITLSRNVENKLSASEATSLSVNPKWLPKDCYHINYYRMVVNDPSKDRAKIARLIEYFLETKTVGRIKLEDKPDTLLYVFPDCNLSQNFGIPSVRTLDVNYLHVLLLKTCPVEYEMDKFNEKLESSIITRLTQLSVNQETGQDESLVKKFVLQQTIRHQNAVQKLKLRQMCGIQLDTRLSLPDIVFSMPQNSSPKSLEATPATSIFPPLPVANKGSKKTTNGALLSLSSSSPEHQDRPYDPTENPLGLADESRRKSLLASHKRTYDDAGLKKSTSTIASSNDGDPSVVAARKKSKKEEKDKLNSKLLEIFAKIENVSVPPAQDNGSAEANIPAQDNAMSQDNNASANDREPSPITTTPGNTVSNNNGHNHLLQSSSEPKSLLGNYYNTGLDSTKFQKTSYRNGISIYNPGNYNASSNSNGYYEPPVYHHSRAPLSTVSSGDKDLRFQDTSVINREIERYSYPSPPQTYHYSNNNNNNTAGNHQHRRPAPNYSKHYVPLQHNNGSVRPTQQLYNNNNNSHHHHHPQSYYHSDQQPPSVPLNNTASNFKPQYRLPINNSSSSSSSSNHNNNNSRFSNAPYYR